MSTDEKAQVLEKVETSHGPKRKVMAELDSVKGGLRTVGIQVRLGIV